MNRVLLSALVAGSLIVPAVAADLSPTPPSFFEPVADWTGFYVGVNGGGGILNGDIMDPECWTCASTTMHTGFGTVGAQVGYNWQLRSFVFGLEGDLNWASASKSTGYALDDGRVAGTANLKMDAFGSIRARGGLALGPAYMYVTAGPAWGHFNSSIVLGDQARPPAVVGVASDNDWRFGLAVGAGIEYMLTPNWIVRGEYLYLDFLDSQQTLNLAPGNGCFSGGSPLVPCKESFANTASVVRVGLNHKFE